MKLPAAVNVNGTEIGAVFSPSGKSLLFARDTKGPDSGESSSCARRVERRGRRSVPRVESSLTVSQAAA